MGNSQANKRVSRVNLNSRYSRNSYSLDQSIFSGQRSARDHSKRGQDSPSPILLDNIAELAIPAPSKQMSGVNSFQQLPKQQLNKQPIQFNEQTMKKSMSVSIADRGGKKTDLSQKLTKLNTKNDQLRKELMKISSELTQKLRHKKFVPKKKQIHPENKNDEPDDPVMAAAVRRELENGYRQIDRLKRMIQNSKKVEGNTSKNEDMLNQIQAKIRDVDWEITQIRFQIRNAKDVARDVKMQLQQTAGIADFRQLEPFKEEIARLTKLSKMQYKGQRGRFQKQKVMQQYMFQLQRKRGKILGEYLPEIKSYANKNYQPDPKYQKHEKKKDTEFINYKPAAWQARAILEQVKTLKQKHEEYHIRMDRALKAKTVIKDESEKLKKDLESASKELESLQYKKERYVQMVMGNIQFLMNQAEDDEIDIDSTPSDSRVETIRTMIKGIDVPQQVFFDDHQIMREMDLGTIKVVSVNLWFTPKQQISAFQMIYYNGKDCFMGNKSGNVTGQMQKQVLQLEEGDYIKNIMGISNRKGAIQYLALYSNKGKARTFGKEMINGVNFTFGLKRKERPVCIAGYTFFDGSYWRLNKLVVDVLAEP